MFTQGTGVNAVNVMILIRVSMKFQINHRYELNINLRFYIKHLITMFSKLIYNIKTLIVQSFVHGNDWKIVYAGFEITVCIA